MVTNKFIWTLLLLIIVTKGYSQKYEIRADFAYEVSEKKATKGLRTLKSLGIQSAIFPFENIPIGFIYNMQFGSYSPFTYRTFDTGSTNNRDTLLKISNSLNRFFFGIKIADQMSRRLINPYFSALFGIGFNKSTFKLEEYVDKADDNDINLLVKERLWRFNGSFYKLETGLEINLFKFFDKGKYNYHQDGSLSLFTSLSFIGSFKNFKYYNYPKYSNEWDSILTKPKDFKSKFLNENHQFNEKIQLWNYTIGLIVRF